MIRADGVKWPDKVYFNDIIAQMLATMCIELVHSMPLCPSFAFEAQAAIWQSVGKSAIETKHLSLIIRLICEAALGRCAR